MFVTTEQRIHRVEFTLEKYNTATIAINTVFLRLNFCKKSFVFNEKSQIWQKKLGNCLISDFLLNISHFLLVILCRDNTN